MDHWLEKLGARRIMKVGLLDEHSSTQDGMYQSSGNIMPCLCCVDVNSSY